VLFILSAGVVAEWWRPQLGGLESGFQTLVTEGRLICPTIENRKAGSINRPVAWHLLQSRSTANQNSKVPAFRFAVGEPLEICTSGDFHENSSTEGSDRNGSPFIDMDDPQPAIPPPQEPT